MSVIWTAQAQKRVIEYILNRASVKTWDVYCHVRNEKRADSKGTLTEGNVASFLESLSENYLTKVIQSRKAIWKIRPECRDSLRIHSINLKK